MSPNLTSRFPNRVMVVGDYDWNDFDVLNREIKNLYDPANLYFSGQLSGRRWLYEDLDEEGTDVRPTPELVEDLETFDDLLLITFKVRGACAMAKGIANMPQGQPAGYQQLNGKLVPYYHRTSTVPCIEIEPEWIPKRKEFNLYSMHTLLKGLKPTKILNFDRSNGKSPAWKQLTKPILDAAKTLNLNVSTIQR